MKKPVASELRRNSGLRRVIGLRALFAGDGLPLFTIWPVSFHPYLAPKSSPSGDRVALLRIPLPPWLRMA